MAQFRRVLLCLVLIVAPTIAAMSATAAATGVASGAIRQLGAEALSVLADSRMTPVQREATFRQLFLKSFDVDLIARFVAGPAWRSASEAERNDFRKLFEDHVVATYSARLSAYSGEQFQVQDEAPAGNDVMVSSTVVRASGPPIRVEWRVRTDGGEPRVMDVVIDGVSMAITQRSEFAAVMQQGGKGLAAVNEKLRAKLARSN